MKLPLNILILFSLSLNGFAANNSIGMSALGLMDRTINAYYQHRIQFDSAMVLSYSNLNNPSLARGLSGNSVSIGYKYYSQNYGKGNYILTGLALFKANRKSEREPPALPIFAIGNEWKIQHLTVGLETGFGTISGTSLISINVAYDFP